MEKNILVKKKLLVSNKVGRMTVNKIFFKSSLTNYGLHHSVFLVIYDIFEKTSEELNRTPKLTIPMTLRCHSLCEPDCTFSLRPMRRLVTHRLVTLTHLFQESHKLSSHKNHLCPRA